MEEQTIIVLLKREEDEIVIFVKMTNGLDLRKSKKELLLIVKNYLDQKRRETIWENKKTS